MKKLLNKFKNWQNTDNHSLWVSISDLIIFGLIAIYSVGAYISVKFGGPDYLFINYLPYALIGFLMMVGFSRLSQKSIVRISWILGIIGLLLMLKTIIAPVMIKGSARYVHLARLYIDPFLMTLPAYIVLMSHWLSKKITKPLWSMIGMTLLTLFIVYAAFIAPYIFMAQIYSLLFILLTFKARKNANGLSKAYIVALVMLIAVVAFAVLTRFHVQTRLLLMFSQPKYSAVWLSRQAVNHSTLIGSTHESLKLLSILPDAPASFMFSGILAKFGILVGLAVLALYGFVAKGLTRIIHNTKDKFKENLATGTLGLFALCVVMSVAAAFGLLNTQSVLPFVSYAPYGILVWCALFGFVLASNNGQKE